MASSADEAAPAAMSSWSVDEMFERMAAARPAPAAGAGIALAVATGAALVAKAARLSEDHDSDAGLIAQQMDALRRQALLLMERDARAYGRVFDAVIEDRPAALAAACDAPLALAEVAVEVVEAAVRLVESGNPRLRGDAMAAALLAESSARSAVALVDENIGGVPGRGSHLEVARRLAHRASRGAAVLASVGGDDA